MDINRLYTDFWELLGTYLSPDDIYSFMLTCRGAYKACQRYTLKSKIAYPMLYPFRLTYEQRSLVKQLEKGQQIFKLIHGDVGSGKTIVSTSYAIRKYGSETSDPESKIVMCGPPNLIEMWWSTLRKYFGIEPCVLHGTSKNYDAKTSWNNKPSEKFILISSRLFVTHQDIDWFKNDRDLLIIDEAHHDIGSPFDRFKEIIGLSATTKKTNGLSNGIRSILSAFGLTINNCTYKLNKSIITKNLPSVEYWPYNLTLQTIDINTLINMIPYTKRGLYDMSGVRRLCNLISHPLILDLKYTFTCGYIMVGRKSLRVDTGCFSLHNAALRQLRIEEPGLLDRQYKKKMAARASFDILTCGNTYPKYVQTYHIIKWANDQGDKVLLFDMNITNLPFLHKYLVGCGINSYIFSTHYDVAGRQRQLAKFKEDTKPGVLLSSVSMLGEGQNVTEANHVIFFTHCLDHTKYYQAMGRCWRYPQRKIVKIHLLFGNMFDRKVYEHACGAVDINTLEWTTLM